MAMTVKELIDHLNKYGGPNDSPVRINGEYVHHLAFSLQNPLQEKHKGGLIRCEHDVSRKPVFDILVNGREAEALPIYAINEDISWPVGD